MRSGANPATRSTPQSGRRRSAPGVMLQVAAGLIWLPQAACIAWVISLITQGAGLTQAFPWALAFLALGVLRASLDTLGQRRTFQHARSQLTEYRNLAAHAMAQRSPHDASRPASAAVASTLAEQADHLVPYLTRFVPARAKSLWIPLCIVIAAGWFSWIAALILIIAAPLIPFFMALVGRKAQEISQAQLVELSSINGFLLDRLRGLGTIRAMDAVATTADDLGKRAQSLRARVMAVLRVAFLSSAVLELFAALGVALVAVYIGFHLLGQLNFGTWAGQLTLGQSLFILLLAPAFFEPLRELAAAWHDRASGQAALAQLQKLQETGIPLVGDSTTEAIAPAIARSAPSVTLHQLSYRHEPSRPEVLTDFSLTIHSQEQLALLGPSGVGKSTLMALIAGFMPTQKGQILIDGIALTESSAPHLRRRIAWVSQRPHIFSGSLLHNITLGRTVTPDQLTQALHLAALDDLVAKRGNTPLAEGGAGLSGGELLRLAIARAALDVQADLILADEPTAHLDQVTARDITQRLLLLAQHKTLIVATHDPLLAAKMQRQVVLQPSTQR